MKIAISFLLCLVVSFFAGKEHGQRFVARELLNAAASADGMEGGSMIRHVAIGTVTNVVVAPDGVSVYGTDGSRHWFP